MSKRSKRKVRHLGPRVTVEWPKSWLEVLAKMRPPLPLGSDDYLFMPGDHGSQESGAGAIMVAPSGVNIHSEGGKDGEQG